MGTYGTFSKASAWSVSDVSDFLDRLPLAEGGKCKTAFKAEFVDGSTLLGLTVDEMRSMGLNMHDAKLIFKEVSEGKSSPDAPTGKAGGSSQNVLFDEVVDMSRYNSIIRSTIRPVGPLSCCFCSCCIPTPKYSGQGRIVVTDAELQLSMAGSQHFAGMYNVDESRRTIIPLQQISSVGVRSTNNSEEYIMVTSTQYNVKPIMIAGVQDLYHLKDVLDRARENANRS